MNCLRGIKMKDTLKLIPKQPPEPVVIATKINCPPFSSNLVDRYRLVEKLNRGLDHKLTLITAPAGYGKSTAVAQWAAGVTIPVAWVSLDEKDNDQALFWQYFIRALIKTHPQIGVQSLEMLNSSRHHSIDVVLNLLINELNSIQFDIAIIIDDFHLITQKEIHASIKYLLNYLPGKAHIYLISRTTPPLPLATLRAKKNLLEINACDLRFSLQEKDDFFKKSNLNLSWRELLNLENYLEGWAAGIQIASGILKNCADRQTFFRDFSGDHHYFKEYFSEEILERQPEAIQDVLLETSILKKMNSSLCRAITGWENSGQSLEWLEKMNLFIAPLHGQCRWFRYHQLFSQSLRALLKQKNPDRLTRLYQKADEWFKYQGIGTKTASKFWLHEICEEKYVETYTFSSSLIVNESLTPREREVLSLLIEGYSNQNIAELLFISIVTVKTHLQNIFRKLQVTSRASAIARVYELGSFAIPLKPTPHPKDGCRRHQKKTAGGGSL